MSHTRLRGAVAYPLPFLTEQASYAARDAQYLYI